jgi:SAM-dependent methyltransferase
VWFESSIGRRVWADEERALLEVLRPGPGDRVLDAGCGDGRLLADLARRGVRVVGVDTSEAMLRAARDRARAGGLPALLVRATVDALPFADNSFDAVTAVTVLCSVAEPGPAVREMARLVRADGRLVIGELGRWSTWALRRRFRSLRHGGSWSLARFWSVRQVKRLLLAAQLRPFRVRGAVFYPRSTAAARVLAPLDRLLGAVTTVGAAFIAVGGRRGRNPGD